MLYAISYIIFHYFIKIFFAGECRGLSNYPRKGPFIVAFNHNSSFDVPSVAIALKFRAHGMGKKELFDVPILRWWMRKVNVHPIVREASDQEGFERIENLLRRGERVFISPEGTRKWKDGVAPRPKTGIIRLAQIAKCPIIPMGIYGTRNILSPGSIIPRWSKIFIRVGAPIRLEPVEVIPENHELLQRQAWEVMDKIYELLPSWAQPVLAKPTPTLDASIKPAR